MRQVMRAVLVLLACSGSVAFAQQYPCTEQGGLASSLRDEEIRKAGSMRGWAPRTWMRWCEQCKGRVTGGRCIGAVLDGAQAGGGAQTPEQAALDAAQRVLNAGNFNTANNAAMTMGAATVTAIGVASLQSLLQPPSAQELARREAVRQERLRLQQEAEARAREEEQRRHAALLAGMRREQGSTGSLALHRESRGGGSNLDLIRRDSAADGGALSPFPVAAPAPLRPDDNLSLLRRGDSAESTGPAAQQLLSAAGHGQNAVALGLQGASSESGQGFDSRGLAIGVAPAAPPEPQGRLVGLQLEDLANAKPGEKFRRTDVVRVLDDTLNTYRAASASSREALARLERQPRPDEARIREERERLERIENERRAVEEKKKKVDEAKDEMIEFTIGESEVGAK